jgi:pilus assembly protein Flp/PilA
MGAGNLCHGDDWRRPGNSGFSIMRNLLRHFIDDQSGITVIEYGLIAILIATTILHVAGMAGVKSLGANLSGAFKSIAAALSH